MKITILLVEDHPLLLEVWIRLFNEGGRFLVVGATADTDKTLELVKRLQPRIVLTDIQMQPVDGVTLTQQIVALTPATHVIIVSFHSDPAYARKLLQAGAMGYVTKNSSKDELFAAILQVHAANRISVSKSRIN